MKSYPLTEIAWNVFSVIAGVLAGIGICFLFYLLAEIFARDIPLRTALWIFVIPCILAAPVLAGFTASILSTRRDVIHAIITGLICAIIVFLEFSEGPSDGDIGFWATLYWIVAGGWIGGMLGVRKKRKKK
jgi:putative membrane protein (TIGR04086 family)